MLAAFCLHRSVEQIVRASARKKFCGDHAPFPCSNRVSTHFRSRDVIETVIFGISVWGSLTDSGVRLAPSWFLRPLHISDSHAWDCWPKTAKSKKRRKTPFFANNSVSFRDEALKFGQEVDFMSFQRSGEGTTNRVLPGDFWGV